MGAMVVTALMLLLMGARVGHWLADTAGMDSALVSAWSYLGRLAVRSGVGRNALHRRA